MTLSRRFRRWVSGAMGMVVLFTQLAIAAYACPGPSASPEPVQVTQAMPDCHSIAEAGPGEGAGSDPGPDPGPAAPQLCKAHCSNDAQSAARTLLPDLQPNPASVALLVRLVEPIPVQSPADSLGRSPLLAHPPDSLPIYLTLLVLRN